jgi:hypothetical protein
MISGKSFSDHCQWVYDPRYPERKQFSYTLSQHGEWVFVNGDYLREFRSKCPLFSPKKFHIIVHNSDRPFGFHELQILLPISLHIYAINTTITDPILTTIPIGFVDKQLPFLKSFQTVERERDIDIYANFTSTTNIKKRRDCIEAFDGNPRVTWKTNLSIDEYYSDLCRSKYVLCPEGTGIDTHRVYEALFCGATPVVLRNSLSHMYEKLPICIVDSWIDDFYKSTRNDFNISPRAYL